MTSYTGREAEGLQTVENNSYPEVVPGSQLSAPHERRSSLNSPEATLLLPQSKHNEKGSVPTSPAPTDYFHNQNPPQYQDHPQDKAVESQEQHLQAKNDRRTCGMKRKTFVWFMILIILVIVLAAVLGGVLGSIYGGKSDDNSNASSNSSSSSQNGGSGFPAQDKTGLAILNPSGQSSLFVYYMDDSGSIVESEFANGVQQSNNIPKATNNVTTGARSGSPIAAVSYTLQSNTQYRQIFYFNSDGNVATVSNAANGGWSQPSVPFTNISAAADSKALTAIGAAVSSNGLDGIRVYSRTDEPGVLQEFGMDFSESSTNPVWHWWKTFDNADGSAGAASVLTNNQNHLYFRSTTSGALQQFTWDYAHITGLWTQGVNTSTSQGVAENGAIAVTSDGQNTDYIFYQGTNSETSRAIFSNGASSISDISSDVATLGAAPVGYNLAATFTNTAIVMNQNNTATTEFLFSSVDRDGSSTGFNSSTA